MHLVGAQVFGSRTVGRISGMMYTLMSPVQFLLTPALKLTLTTFYDDFRPLNLMQLAALLPMILLTCVLQRSSSEPSVQPPRRSGPGGHRCSFGGGGGGGGGAAIEAEELGMLPRSPGPSPSFSRTGPQSRRAARPGWNVAHGNEYELVKK